MVSNSAGSVVVFVLFSSLLSLARGQCTRALRFGTGQSRYALEVPLTSGAGRYELTALAKYTSDYDGERFFMQSQWFETGGKQISRQNLVFDAEAWPKTADTYELISEMYDSKALVPGRLRWHVGYPGENTKGAKFITDLQVTGPDGVTYIVDGDFATGENLELFDPFSSFGDYAIVDDCEPLTPSSTPTTSSMPSGKKIFFFGNFS